MPGAAIQILGVNEVGHESQNAAICSGRDLPWLQETMASRIWEPWAVTYRDVIVLDGQNRAFGVYNLTANDLALDANYAAMKALILEAWEAETKRAGR